MEEVIIRQEFDHSYALFKMQEEKESFPVRMILQNSIPGFLTCKLRYIEETPYYSYDITSKKSLENEYKERKIGFSELQEIFYEISRIMKKANEFLLSQEGFLLDPRYIFVDLESEELFCLYLPPILFREKEKNRERYRELADFLLDKTDHKDEHAVNVAYQFYKMSKEEFFSFEVFVGFMEKEALLAQAQVRQKEERKRTEESGVERNISPEADFFPVSEVDNQKKRELKWWIPVILLGLGSLLAGIYLLIPGLRVYALYLLLPGASLIGLAVIMAVHIIYQKFRGNEEDDWQEPLEPVRVEEYFDDLMDSETVFFDEEIFICLKWKEGHFSKEHYLKDFPITVGKMRDSVQICIEDPSVSRLHARFKEQGNAIILQDLDSTNGTFVNGKRLAAGEEALIKRNDEIQFGKIIVNVV